MAQEEMRDGNTKDKTYRHSGTDTNFAPLPNVILRVLSREFHFIDGALRPESPLLLLRPTEEQNCIRVMFWIIVVQYTRCYAS